MKETRQLEDQQKKVPAVPVWNNLDQGVDGRVSSYLSGEIMCRGKEAERLVSLLDNFVQGFENPVEIITKKYH